MAQSIKNTIYRALRWSEKYTKTDMIYLISGGFWLTAGQGVASVSAFALAVAFANLLPQQEYGVYKYILSIAGILTTLTLTGIGTTVIRSSAKGFDGSLKQAFSESIKWSIAFLVVMVGIATYYILRENILFGISILLVGTLQPFITALSLSISFSQGKKKFFDAAVQSGTIVLTSSVVTILTLFYTSNIFIILASFLGTQLLVSLLFYIFVVAEKTTNKEKDPEMIPYAKHLSVINAFNVIALHLDKVLVFQFIGPAQLAVYAFAIAIPEQLKALAKKIAAIALPKFTERNMTEIQTGMFGKMTRLFILMSLFIGLYIFIAPFIYKLFFPTYIESIFYSQIYAVSLLGMISTLPITALQAKKETKKLYLVNILGSLFQILTMIIGISFYGLLGLVFGRVIGRIGNMIIVYFFFKTK